jgi:hypothetical protein
MTGDLLSQVWGMQAIAPLGLKLVWKVIKQPKSAAFLIGGNRYESA